VAYATAPCQRALVARRQRQDVCPAVGANVSQLRPSGRAIGGKSVKAADQFICLTLIAADQLRDESSLTVICRTRRVADLYCVSRHWKPTTRRFTHPAGRSLRVRGRRPPQSVAAFIASFRRFFLRSEKDCRLIHSHSIED
jgi:hypothetical protein